MATEYMGTERKTLRRAVIFSLLGCAVAVGGCQQQNGNKAGAIADYAAARIVFWEELYAGQVETLYCGDVFDSRDRRGYNIEHVFPMSWVTNALDCGTRSQCRNNSSLFNSIEADLHNLYPVRTAVNSARASFRFAEVKGEARQFGRSCDFEVNQRARVAEPRPARRGEVARAMFYMAHRYKPAGLTIFRRSGKILQQWHNEDPPTESERRRNRKIAELQGTANEFIEQPSLLNELISEGYFY